MPAIAKAVLASGAHFYWHLGDFRALYTFDEDYLRTHRSPPPAITDYLADAWPDFIRSQLLPFGKLPVFLAIGNHELYVGRTRDQLVTQFADWLNAPDIRAQRLTDNSSDFAVHTYYHWRRNGIDFITLDNASEDEFDAAQLGWIKRTLDADKSDSSVRAIVAGMHEALPESISRNHSMNQSAQGTDSGRQVYEWLLNVRRSKPVYVLASHSHFLMEGTYNTEYWRTHGGVLPGWIVGTAGAVRYDLPPAAHDAKQAKTHVYGYVLATVSDSESDPIHFEFHELAETDVPSETMNRFSPRFVHACWSLNPPPPE